MIDVFCIFYRLDTLIIQWIWKKNELLLIKEIGRGSVYNLYNQSKI